MKMSQYVRNLCVVMFSNVVLCVFRRTFFDVTQVFSDTVWRFHRAGDQESRCRAVMFNEISVDVLLLSMM